MQVTVELQAYLAQYSPSGEAVFSYTLSEGATVQTLVRELSVPEEMAAVIVINERSGDFEDLAGRPARPDAGGDSPEREPACRQAGQSKDAPLLHVTSLPSARLYLLTIGCSRNKMLLQPVAVRIRSRL